MWTLPHTIALTLFTCNLQAWATATGVRLCLNKVPFMNMENYDKDIWMLHRKIFHRFLKYFKYFNKASEELPEFQQLLAEELVSKVKVEKKREKQQNAKSHIICLLTSSSEEVSQDEEEEEETHVNDDEEEEVREEV